MPLSAFAGRDGGDETLSGRAKPGSSCPVRNDETTSTPPDMCPGPSPQPHSGHAEETRRYGRDPSGAAGPQPRSFRLERLDEKTNPAPTNVSAQWREAAVWNGRPQPPPHHFPGSVN